MEHKERLVQLENNHLAALQEKMADTIGRWSVGKEDCGTSIPNLALFRRESSSQTSACKIEPSLVLVVQGAKQLLVGERSYSYDKDSFLINSLDIPGNSKTLAATVDTPCLGLVMRLDLRIIAELIAQGGLPPPSEQASGGSSALGKLTPALLEPISRLVALLDDPGAIAILAPLIQREIHYRLLCTGQAARLWQIASIGSMSHRISRAIEWLRGNFTRPLRIEELAAHVQMSTSNLHLHFRQLTTMSPLQYQKWLRLNEARQLMLNGRLDAATAAFQVGYESASQFSREYGRLFGAPPKRDIEGLRRYASPAIRNNDTVLT